MRQHCLKCLGGLSELFIKNMKELHTPCFDQFLAGLTEDEYGNIHYDKLDDDGTTSHNTITLNCSHHPTRRGLDRLDKV